MDPKERKELPIPWNAVFPSKLENEFFEIQW